MNLVNHLDLIEEKTVYLPYWYKGICNVKPFVRREVNIEKLEQRFPGFVNIYNKTKGTKNG